MSKNIEAVTVSILFLTIIITLLYFIPPRGF